MRPLAIGRRRWPRIHSSCGAARLSLSHSPVRLRPRVRNTPSFRDTGIRCAPNKTYYCTAVRREIGKEQRVKVSNGKGIANQTGPESCVAHREVRDEALTGEPAGQPLSRESNKLVQGADALVVAEGDTDRRDSASAWMTLRGLRPWHVGKFRAREPGDLLLGRSSCNGAVRIGKTRSRSR